MHTYIHKCKHNIYYTYVWRCPVVVAVFEKFLEYERNRVRVVRKVLYLNTAQTLAGAKT